MRGGGGDDLVRLRAPPQPFQGGIHRLPPGIVIEQRIFDLVPAGIVVSDQAAPPGIRLRQGQSLHEEDHSQEQQRERQDRDGLPGAP